MKKSKTVQTPYIFNGEKRNIYTTIVGKCTSPEQVLIHVSKSGADNHAIGAALAELITLALDKGAVVKDVIDILINIKGSCSTPWPEGKTIIQSFPDAVGKALQEAQKNNAK